jgi:hypothetical protein
MNERPNFSVCSECGELYLTESKESNRVPWKSLEVPYASCPWFIESEDAPGDAGEDDQEDTPRFIAKSDRSRKTWSIVEDGHRLRLDGKYTTFLCDQCFERLAELSHHIDYESAWREFSKSMNLGDNQNEHEAK